MLLRFSVQNFLSFKDVQTLDLTANFRFKESLDLNSFSTGNHLIPHVLKAAAVLGPNASGKSNLLKAMQTLRALVIRKEVVGPNPMTRVKPFLFVESDNPDPVYFGVQLLLGGVLYEYALSVRKGIIVAESLRTHGGEGKRWRNIFSRELTAEDSAATYTYRYGAGFGAGRKTLEARTSPDATFLGTAFLFDVKTVEHELFTIERMMNDAPFKSAVTKLVKSADPGISEIHLRKRKVPGMSVSLDPLKGEAQVTNEDRELIAVTFQHDAGRKTWALPFEDESLGKSRFLHLAGPLIDLQNKEITLCLDEIESILHTLLFESIIEMFQKENPNPSGSQLVFTTHCESLLDNGTINPDKTILRRDQIWFVDKNSKLESKLYCLDEFLVRKSESIRRGYRLGRYKAIPQLFDI